MAAQLYRLAAVFLQLAAQLTLFAANSYICWTVWHKSCALAADFQVLAAFLVWLAAQLYRLAAVFLQFAAQLTLFAANSYICWTVWHKSCALAADFQVLAAFLVWLAAQLYRLAAVFLQLAAQLTLFAANSNICWTNGTS
ncbi:hypothetical protein MWJ95_05610 [Lysinibacillus sp. Bpr_S20]|nr:hypothetical protein [Lysinibacillus sp. Bpr_S20]